LNAAPDGKLKKGDTWNAAIVATVTATMKNGETISFDGNGDDAPMHGFLMNRIRLETHGFGTITIADNEVLTAGGESDSTVLHSGRNEKWSLRRG
jgi:hypothetical protein